MENYTVVRINLFTCLLKSRNVTLFRLSTTCLACGIGIPDRMMTKPRTKSGFVGVFDVRGVNNFLVGLAERHLVDVDVRGTGGVIPSPSIGGLKSDVSCQRGPGRSTAQKRIKCCIFEVIWWRKNLVCLLVTILAQINPQTFFILKSQLKTTNQAPYNNEILILSCIY